ncbi:MAG: aldehyde dehydrogenase (NADP(+)) [Planctomycetota bacterium]
MSGLTGSQIVAGRESRGGLETFRAHDPRDGAELPGEFHEATTDEIDRALDAARHAHESWRRAPRESRARLLEAIAAEIEAIGEILTARATAETGLPAARLEAERGRTVGQLRLFAATVRDGAHLEARIDRALPDRRPLPRPDLRSMMVPLGPVAVFGASNFPLAFSVAGGDTASALAAGCPVVVKGHPAHPGTSELVGRAITRAVAAVEAPAGLFSLLQGRGPAVGEGLVTHPATRAVGFTGSFAGGRALCALAATRAEPIPVFAEMGSVNPVVLLPGALAERGAELATAIAASATLGVGQFCTQPGLLLALAGEATERFAAALAAAFEGAAEAPMLHEGIAAAFAAGCGRLERSGARRVAGAEAARRDSWGRPRLYRADYGEVESREDWHEECFGPSSLLVVCDDAVELLEALGRLPGQLTATLHAGAADEELAASAAERLEERAGRVLFAGVPTGVEVSPAMVHGGPWPASSDARSTSVGTAAVRRFLRPICWQDAPPTRLPPELRDEAAGTLPRLVDGRPEAGPPRT